MLGGGHAWGRAHSHGVAWVMDAHLVLDMIQALGPIPATSQGRSTTPGEAAGWSNKTFTAKTGDLDAGSDIKEGSARRKTAEGVVASSCAWGPNAGLFKGLCCTEPRAMIVREAAINWGDACGPQRGPTEEHRQGIVLDASILKRKAAAAPVGVWGRLQFLRKHLGAPLGMSQVTRLAWQAGSAGVATAGHQAVAVQPEHLGRIGWVRRPCGEGRC